MTFIIPLLSIQNYLLELPRDSRVEEVKKFCRENVDQTSYFKVTEDLERQWFPVVITDSVQLATKVMQRFVKQKGE